MFDCTVKDLAAIDGRFDCGSLPQPQLEPEIVIHLANPPHAGISDDEFMDCVDWIADGFEIVHSIFPGWVFTAADAAAAYGVHSALLLGDRCPISGNRTKWRDALSNFTVRL
jgi:2-oxo-3-hexenedioate decarboxylase